VALACARAACGVRIWNVRCVIACVGACGASDVRHRAWLRESALARARARGRARIVRGTMAHGVQPVWCM